MNCVIPRIAGGQQGKLERRETRCSTEHVDLVLVEEYTVAEDGHPFLHACASMHLLVRPKGQTEFVRLDSREAAVLRHFINQISPPGMPGYLGGM